MRRRLARVGMNGRTNRHAALIVSDQALGRALSIVDGQARSPAIWPYWGRAEPRQHQHAVLVVCSRQGVLSSGNALRFPLANCLTRSGGRRRR
jgi:hypothetical protein